MEVRVDLLDGMRFEGRGGDDVAVTMDADPSHGGVGSGLRPLELLLAGLGGCAGMDVISILRKGRQEVTAYRIELSAKQQAEHPHVFTAVAMKHTVTGRNLSSEAVERAISLSEQKYCPAFAMLHKATPITSTYEIVPTGPVD